MMQSDWPDTPMEGERGCIVEGPVSDSLAPELTATGAPELELAQAYAWLNKSPNK
jgi:hypothetical protein